MHAEAMLTAVKADGASMLREPMGSRGAVTVIITNVRDLTCHMRESSAGVKAANRAPSGPYVHGGTPGRTRCAMQCNALAPPSSARGACRPPDPSPWQCMPRDRRLAGTPTRTASAGAAEGPALSLKRLAGGLCSSVIALLATSPGLFRMLKAALLQRTITSRGCRHACKDGRRRVQTAKLHN